MTNRLKDETSPYLLQHRDNPVDWHPWGRDALNAARQQDKPILLSVGYAACHWCHVMAHESFEDPAIAALMNDLFINIKVDREERPDLDAIYQKALALMGQHGGWPLTMFLTPAGEPFFGGTYFPPQSRWGRSGFPDVLKAVDDAWTNRREKLLEEAQPLLTKLRQEPRRKGQESITLEDLDFYASRMVNGVDRLHGGLEGAPKFPHCGYFDRLWRSALKSGDQDMKDAVTLTLDRMFRGGIYDHLGGGVMRYSTDEFWLVPHFEKMLYDNAQALDLLCLVWQTDRNPFHAKKIEEIIGWVLREMIAEHGAFAATLDADDPGGEGHFYTWTKDEIDRILPPDSAALFAKAYDVTKAGNWEGRVILQRLIGSLPFAQEQMLDQARTVLFQQRDLRPRPGRDHKVLADWNGMMIAALAQASFIFDRPDWLAAARRAYDAVKTHMALPGNRLAHSLCNGRVSEIGVLDDLAHMARAALFLYEVTGNEEFNQDAVNWAEAAHINHLDEQNGGYFQNHHGADDVIAWLKPVHDNAVPAANGVLLEVFAKLWSISGNALWLDYAQNLLEFLGPMIPTNFPHMTAALIGLETMLDPVQVVIGQVVAGSFKEYERVVAETPLPTRVLIRQKENQSAHICRHGTCSEPVNTPEELRKKIGRL